MYIMMVVKVMSQTIGLDTLKNIPLCISQLRYILYFAILKVELSKHYYYLNIA